MTIQQSRTANPQPVAKMAVVTMLVAALIISTSSVWVKLADMGASAIGFYRMCIGGLVLIVICLLRGRSLWQGWAHHRWL